MSAAALIAMVAVGCSSTSPGEATSSDEVNKSKGPSRDFAAHPAMVAEYLFTTPDCEILAAAQDWIERRDFLFALGHDDAGHVDLHRR